MTDRTFAIESAGYWFGEARRAQKEGRMSDALLCMENAFNHTENALAAERERCAKIAEPWQGALVGNPGEQDDPIYKVRREIADKIRNPER